MFKLKKMGLKRSFTETIKKKIAASQKWKCSGCEQLLESTYQVDHSIPLWAGGEDCPDNATALCPNCHAIKTQAEASVRAKRIRETNQQRVDAARECVLKEEQAFCRQLDLGNGKKKCRACGKVGYALFPHECPVARSRAESRFKKKIKPNTNPKNTTNFFDVFLFTNPP